MRPSPLFSRSSPASLSSSVIPLLFLLLPGLAHGADECIITADGVEFDLSPLKGPSSVTVSKSTPPSTTNMTWFINPCGPLKWSKDDRPEESCPEGSHVCGIEWIHSSDPKKDTIHRIIPISGDFGDAGSVAPTYTRLKTSEAQADQNKEGVRVEMHGGTYPPGDDGQKQSAVVEYICAPNRTGMEGQKQVDSAETEEEKREVEKSLKFISYENNVLKLEWRTMQACEKVQGGNGDTSRASHWGFFTWFIIIFFMIIAAYLIFGSWLNYNRYGAKGWDLLPHADTLRDIPYLAKEYVRKVIQTLQGGGVGGRRAGYSAV
ncbi:autophagy-related protein 27 [Kalaharituber pfeilii]|nr:autophagy-related protein 27 [Kalaharituber pfeilii]